MGNFNSVKTKGRNDPQETEFSAKLRPRCNRKPLNHRWLTTEKKDRVQKGDLYWHVAMSEWYPVLEEHIGIVPTEFDFIRKNESEFDWTTVSDQLLDNVIAGHAKNLGDERSCWFFYWMVPIWQHAYNGATAERRRRDEAAYKQFDPEA